MSEFEDVKPYTQAELDQQAIWANEFNQWWENEGQYQRAGGGQYERTFAWWAWLNREQKQQAIIDDLRSQLNNMEACYIEKKKRVEDALSRIESLMVHAAADYENTKSTSMMCAVQELGKALRGAND
jgi:hypothetical protein